jgi:hypothetical protein
MNRFGLFLILGLMVCLTIATRMEKNSMLGHTHDSNIYNPDVSGEHDSVNIFSRYVLIHPLPYVATF